MAQQPPSPSIPCPPSAPAGCGLFFAWVRGAYAGAIAGNGAPLGASAPLATNRANTPGVQVEDVVFILWRSFALEAPDKVQQIESDFFGRIVSDVYYRRTCCRHRHRCSPVLRVGPLFNFSKLRLQGTTASLHARSLDENVPDRATKRGGRERTGSVFHGFSTAASAVFRRCSPVPAGWPLCRLAAKWRNSQGFMVGDTGIEPVTPPV